MMGDISWITEHISAVVLQAVPPSLSCRPTMVPQYRNMYTLDENLNKTNHISLSRPTTVIYHFQQSVAQTHADHIA